MSQSTSIQKGIKAQICLQRLDRSLCLPDIYQIEAKLVIREIGIERNRALELRDSFIVTAFEHQDRPKLGMSKRQIGIADDRLRGQLVGTLQSGEMQILVIKRLNIG